MNEEFRKTAPEALPAIPFNIPHAESFSLSNGLKVVVIEDRRFPTISMRLGIRFGDVNDPVDGTGINSAMASLLTEGTENYSSRELAEKIDSLGADLSVGSGYDNTVVRVSSLSSQFEEVCGLMAEVLLRPVFPEKEIALYKQNAIEGLKYQRSQPDFLADEQVAKVLYGDHPYSINSPNEDDFKKLDRDNIVISYRSGIIPNNSVLVAVGDISAEQLRQLMEQYLDGWERGELPSYEFAEPPARDHRTLTIVDRPGSSQSNIVLANLAIKRSSEDYFPFLIMNQVLGAGASSRLFMNLREAKGYTYGAYSKIYARRLAGSLEATSEVRTSVTGDSLKEFFYELERIRDERVTVEELDDAKNFLAGVFPIRAETQSGLVGLVSAQQLNGLPEDYLETYRDNVRNVTAEDVMRVANTYIHPDKLALVIVGDAHELLTLAGSYAEDISICDTAGKIKNREDYVVSETAEIADLSGSWALLIDAQGQELPVSIVISQDGNSISGEMESMLGTGELRDGSVNGNRFSATVESDFQGETLEMSLSGVKKGDSIDGTITVPMMPEPLSFKGSKE